ncbi:hypothetical protein ACFX1W_030351 [Malus domestica]
MLFSNNFTVGLFTSLSKCLSLTNKTITCFRLCTPWKLHRYKLQHSPAETVSDGQLGEGSCVPQMANAMKKLEALESFVTQANHLQRQNYVVVTGSSCLSINHSASSSPFILHSKAHIQNA